MVDGVLEEVAQRTRSRGVTNAASGQTPPHLRSGFPRVRPIGIVRINGSPERLGYLALGQASSTERTTPGSISCFRIFFQTKGS
jgi:hypothetical protein